MRSAENIQGGEFGGGGTKEDSWFSKSLILKGVQRFACMTFLDLLTSILAVVGSNKFNLCMIPIFCICGFVHIRFVEFFFWISWVIVYKRRAFCLLLDMEKQAASPEFAHFLAEA
jgi:hypothetical protein